MALTEQIAGLSAEKRELVKRRLLERQAASPVVSRRETPGPYPVPYSAQLMWLLNRFVTEPSVYNVNICLRLKGDLNLTALQRSLNTLVARHEGLRTNITAPDGVPLQIVRDPSEVDLRILDVPGRTGEEQEAELGRMCLAQVRRTLDPEKDLLFQAVLLRIDPRDHVLILLTHHMVFDGWSRRTVHRELGVLYSAYCEYKENPLPELPLQFADYALWQRSEAQTLVIERQLEYWKQKLSGAPQVLELPADHPRPAVQSFRGARVYASFPQASVDALKKLSNGEGATLFMTFLAALNVLLFRYTGRQDILVGAPILGRPRPELEGIVGYFSNTVVIRTDLSGDPPFRELLRRVRATVLEAMEHQDAPLEKLTMEMHPERDPSRSPLFQVMIGFGDDPPRPSLAGLDVSPVRIDHDTSKLDLVLAVRATDSHTTAVFEYNADLFDAATPARMLEHFRLLLEGIAANPDQRVSRLPLVTEAEKRHMLLDWNRTAVDYPRDSVLHQLVEEQAARTPGAPAVEFEGQTLTYGELMARANGIARLLCQRGAAPESRVALFAERSLELAPGLLGILKAGAACVPLDPGSPRGRLEAIVRDAGITLALTQHRFLPQLTGLGVEAICLDTEQITLSRESYGKFESAVQAENLAFLLYTSGSTGVPKGVLLTHRGLVNHQIFSAGYYGLRAQDRVLQFAPLTSDFMLEEVFPAWARGATVVLRPPSLPLGGREFGRWLASQRITMVDLQTAFWHEWARSLAAFDDPLPLHLRLVIIGGEKAQTQALMDWRKKAGPGVRWTNTYGPTETSIIATTYEPSAAPEDPRVSIPIGRPIANARIYILDDHLQLAPIGVAGELHIGGEGLARGYLNRPDLETERFIPDPFSAAPDGRLYKTGDLARYLPDGNIEFLGRIDRQVKVRGYRVEPGEIESALAQHPAVAGAAVLDREHEQGRVRLVAYVTPKPGQAPESGELRRFLKERLPEYMVPATLVILDGSLPLDSRGKLDRGALQALDGQRTSFDNEFVAPRDALEIQLANLWEKLLGVRPIGRQDDFFELGGHSLLSVALFARIEKKFGVSLPVATILQAQTVGELAAILREQGWQPRWTSLVPVQPGGSRPPLFCVHAQSGHVLFYRDLARHLGDDQPLYALQSVGGDGKRPPLSRVEDMAAHYIEEVLTLQPEGPYYLLGFCVGAYVAFEMARQLEQRGQKVALLAVVDTEGGWKMTGSLRGQIEYHRRRTSGLTLERHLGYFAGRLRFRASSMLRTLAKMAGECSLRLWHSLPRNLRSLYIYQLNVEASRKYRPGTYGGSLVYLQGKDGLAQRPTAFWGRVAAGGVEICTLSGRSSNLFREPNVKHLAEALKSHLDRASGGGPARTRS